MTGAVRVDGAQFMRLSRSRRKEFRASACQYVLISFRQSCRDIQEGSVVRLTTARCRSAGDFSLHLGLDVVEQGRNGHLAFVASLVVR